MPVGNGVLGKVINKQEDIAVEPIGGGIMNVIDIILFVVIVMSVISGYHKGFLYGTLDLLLLILGIAFAIWSSRYIAAFFEKYVISIGVWTLPLAFIIAYIFARVILGALIARPVQRIPERVHGHVANKALGIIPGVANGMIYAAIISSLLLALAMFDGFSSKIRESSIANALTPHVQWAEAKLAPVFEEAVNQTMNSLTVEPQSEKSIDLPFAVNNPEARGDLEAEMLELINEERKAEGLPALAADPEMTAVARLHSRDMFAKGYFSHINKEGETPAQRARQAGVHFLVVGENLAFAQTLRIAHAGLMDSPGHRANILNKSFGRVGIGILDGGKYGLMVTQNFRN